MSAPLKLSSPATREFWELPVLFADAHLLAVAKPPRLLTAPDPTEPDRPDLMRLLHDGIAAGKPWTKSHGLDFLMCAYRLDFETSGVLLLGRSKAVLATLADEFNTDRPLRTFVALVDGAPKQREFEVNAPLAPHPLRAGLMRVDPRGKQARTRFQVLETFARHTLIQCQPLTDRRHQIRLHLRRAGLRLVGDRRYDGPLLWLSRLKRGYRLKPDKEERPLVKDAALHLERLELRHPVTGEPLRIEAAWPKELSVAVKYLRRYAVAG